MRKQCKRSSVTLRAWQFALPDSPRGHCGTGAARRSAAGAHGTTPRILFVHLRPQASARAERAGARCTARAASTGMVTSAAEAISSTSLRWIQLLSADKDTAPWALEEVLAANVRRSFRSANRLARSGFTDALPTLAETASTDTVVSGPAAGNSRLLAAPNPRNCRWTGRRSSRIRDGAARPIGLPGQMAVAAAILRARCSCFFGADWPPRSLPWQLPISHPSSSCSTPSQTEASPPLAMTSGLSTVLVLVRIRLSPRSPTFLMSRSLYAWQLHTSSLPSGLASQSEVATMTISPGLTGRTGTLGLRQELGLSGRPPHE